MFWKHCLWKRHHQNTLDTNILLAYEAAEVKCCDLITGFEVRKEREIMNSKNNGSFYRHVNKRLSNGRGTGTLIDASVGSFYRQVNKGLSMGEVLTPLSMRRVVHSIGV